MKLPLRLTVDKPTRRDGFYVARIVHMSCVEIVRQIGTTRSMARRLAIKQAALLRDQLIELLEKEESK